MYRINLIALLHRQRNNSTDTLKAKKLKKLNKKIQDRSCPNKIDKKSQKQLERRTLF